ncbi:hypothetical protein [Paracoccus sp. TOH]|uniref:hypothetical protein n=1 Tax=Paracoccus sp. TOH TaxID=1263728 RepID=UPI0025AFE37C|nr:hypothetical protein [Paracoccus sp. TOH]WJS84233.1 hypothetical protein NBE95_00120 [Paracoccus sp. TOH]
MSADSFRLTLAICAVLAMLGYLASVDGQLMGLVVILGLFAGLVWLLWRLGRWAWRRY